jgi:hypothetical protein
MGCTLVPPVPFTYEIRWPRSCRVGAHTHRASVPPPLGRSSAPNVTTEVRAWATKSVPSIVCETQRHCNHFSPKLASPFAGAGDIFPCRAETSDQGTLAPVLWSGTGMRLTKPAVDAASAPPDPRQTGIAYRIRHLDLNALAGPKYSARQAVFACSGTTSGFVHGHGTGSTLRKLNFRK